MWRRVPWALVLCVGCAASTPPAPAAPPRPSFTASHVGGFTDTYAVTALADGGAFLWVGSTRGLLRWDLAAGRYDVIGTREGLPADRVTAIAVDHQGAVWVATDKGLSRGQQGGWQNLPPAPVGPFVTGLSPLVAGKGVWAGGPEGLARWRNGRWERFLAETSVTALALDDTGNLWVGTGGKGILRIPPSGDRVEQFAAPQACETDVVRGLAPTDRGVLAVGEGAGGPRAALWDGERFHSYTIESPSLLEWAARAEHKLVVGAGARAWEIALVTPTPETPPAAPSTLRFSPTGSVVAKDGKLVTLAANLASSVLEDPGPPTLPHAPPKAAPPPEPRFDVTEWTLRLPEGVTAIAGGERGLLVGTRFIGAARIENGVLRRLRALDLVAGAARITVACAAGDVDDCYLATGGGRAWRFDGQAFALAEVDPEPGSRVLAVLRDPKGEVMAIHRGASDPHLRISVAADGKWTPVSMEAVQVPLGVPDLNFAAFAPDGKLWLGLRYLDKDQDAVDDGAAELDLASGTVAYHRQAEGAAVPLPNDTVAMYWRGDEGWFATRSGVALYKDGKVRLFTENDNLESELIYDIGPGPRGEIWVATRHGVGRWNGARWQFPKMGPYYLAATSLGHDTTGHIFLGTEKGLFCVGDCAPEGIDSRRGLLDDAVLDLTVDTRNRVWVLTEKGISIVEP